MRQDASTPRRFMSAVGGVIDLDGLLVEQERRKVHLEDELGKTKARFVDIKQRLQRLAPGDPRRYATLSGQIDLDQALVDTKARRNRLEEELAHASRQLEEVRRRIEAYDRNRKVVDG